MHSAFASVRLVRLIALGVGFAVCACSDATSESALGDAGTSFVSAGTSGASGAAGTGGSTAAAGSSGAAELGGEAAQQSGGSGGSAGTTTGSAGASQAGAGGATVTPLTPSAAARQKVLDYFAKVRGTGTLMGIHNKGTTHADNDKVKSLTGKLPALWGNDFGFGSGGVGKRDAMTTEAIAEWQAGAVVALMYHACAPTRDEYCSWSEIGGSAPTHLSDAEFAELVTPGTGLYKAWIARLDTLAIYFQRLKDAGVAPMFRPFHEVNQCKFWWGCHAGDQGSRRLFQITHDYLVHDKGLDNIVWNWNIQDFPELATDVTTYNPGPDYFDLVSLDVYSTDYTTENYQIMQGISAGKPLAIGECKYMPTAEKLAAQPQWLYAMLWPDFYADNPNLSALYQSPPAITLDEMPGWQ